MVGSRHANVYASIGPPRSLGRPEVFLHNLTRLESSKHTCQMSGETLQLLFRNRVYIQNPNVIDGQASPDSLALNILRFHLYHKVWYHDRKASSFAPGEKSVKLRGASAVPGRSRVARVGPPINHSVSIVPTWVSTMYLSRWLCK